MKPFRYQLLNNSNQHLAGIKAGKKLRCPSCGQKRFVPYVDTKEGGLVDENVYGRCERVNNCQYHHRPTYQKPEKKTPKPDTPMIEHPYHHVEKSCARELGVFSCWIVENFGEAGTAALKKYRVGTSNKPFQGASIFWQIDKAGRVHAGKIMGYQVVDGLVKRVREPRPQLQWAHKLAGLEGELNQCLFGLHLVNEEPEKPVCIVESEKTAIIGSIFHPEAVWLATGGAGNMRAMALMPVVERTVRVLPDGDKVGDWQRAVDEMEYFMEDCELLDWGGTGEQDPADVLLETGAPLELGFQSESEGVSEPEPEPEVSADTQPEPEPEPETDSEPPWPPEPQFSWEVVQNKSPAVSALMSRLDMVVESIEPYTPEPNPEPVAEKPPLVYPENPERLGQNRDVVLARNHSNNFNKK